MVIELVEIGIRGPTLLVGLHGGEVGSRFKVQGSKFKVQRGVSLCLIRDAHGKGVVQL